MIVDQQVADAGGICVRLGVIFWGSFAPGGDPYAQGRGIAGGVALDAAVDGQPGDVMPRGRAPRHPGVREC